MPNPPEAIPPAMTPVDGPAATEARRAALAVLALARPEEMAPVLAALPESPGFEIVRPPESGLVMVRGRVGGGGAPFNLGEVTVTRAVARIGTGEVGFGHVLGRDKARALMVAQLDALWQSERHREAVEAGVIGPVRRRVAAEDAAARRKTAATRVDFFTLVRGDDP